LITPVQEEAWFALLYAHALVTNRIEKILLERHGISFSSFEIVCRLIDREPQPVRALAAQLVSVSPTRASRLMQELVDSGRLRRGADQSDGRVSLVSHTEEGRRWAAAVSRTFEESVRDHFALALDPEDLAALTRIRKKLDKAATSPT
jgi:DNA-binding MarR family transcriptional regulator